MDKLFHRIILIIAAVAAGGHITASAQTSLSGTVKDTDGLEVIGASVIIEGTTIGTITDIDGHWSLDGVPAGAHLVISSIGYVSATVDARNCSEIILKTDSIMLDEVVAIGYGVVKKSDVTGSVTSVKGDRLQKTPASGLDQALQGVAAGVTVNSGTGQPGAAAEVRIRGIGTVNNSAPIYVVDGVIVDNINFLSPNDISSTEILKDASATAIYGSRGANGVILVTTRKGGSDGKTNISFDAYAGVQTRWRTLDLMQSEEFAHTLAAMTNTKRVTYLEKNGIDSFIRKYYIGKSKWYPSNMDYGTVETDWQDEVFRPAVIQNYHISMDHGTKDGFWAMSGSWFNQDGTVIGSDYSRMTLRVNSAHKVKPWLKVGENLSFMYSYGRNAMNNSSSPSASVISAAIAMAPWDPARYPVGAKSNTGEDLGNSISAASNFKNVTNPLSMVSHSYPDDKTERWVGDVFAEISPLEGLTLRSDVSLDLTNYRHKLFKEAYQHSDYDKMSKNFIESSMARYSTVIVENTLTYSKDFGKHYISAMIGQTTEEYNAYSIGGSGSSILIPSESNWYLSQTTEDQPKSSDTAARARRFSLLSRLHYSYDSRYMLTLNFRADGSSKFQENLWGYFPSAALAWRLSKEEWMADCSEWLEDLKLRAGWGRIGNDKIGDNAFLLTVFNTGPTFVDYVFGTGDQGLANGATILTYINKGGRWETTEQMNFGVDFGLWGNRLTGTFEVFRRDTKEMLLSVKAPANVGNRYDATANVGTVSNKGLELSLEHRNSIGSLSYSIGGNVSLISNRLESLNGGEKVWGDKTLCDEGLPLYTFWGYVYEGVDSETGDAVYKDLNKDGLIDDNDRTALGNPFPWFNCGLNMSAEWKGFDLQVFFQGVAGNSIYNALRLRTEGTGNEATLSTSMRDVWSTTNPDGSIPNPNGSPKNRYDSSRFVEDGSYLRLKNIQLGYTLPSSLTAKMGISRARVYLSCANLLTLTAYTGYDPEVGGGVDYGNYPQARTAMLGVNVNF